MLNEDILKKSISTMHPLEAIEVERRVSESLALVARSLLLSQKINYHEEFLASLFDVEYSDISAALDALPPVQQAFFRAIGAGTLKPSRAFGFGDDNNKASVILSWVFCDNEGSDKVLFMELLEDFDGHDDNGASSTHYYVHAIQTMIDDQVYELNGDPAEALITVAHEYGIDVDATDGSLCFDADEKLPAFSDWSTELAPTHEESAKSIIAAIKSTKPSRAMGVMDAYIARHGHAIDYDEYRLLPRASMRGSIAIIERMVKEGATVDLADNGGVTSMFYAIRNGNKQVVETLLSLGSNAKDAVTIYREADKKNPSILAVLEKSILATSNNKPRTDEEFGL